MAMDRGYDHTTREYDASQHNAIQADSRADKSNEPDIRGLCEREGRGRVCVQVIALGTRVDHMLLGDRVLFCESFPLRSSSV